MKDFKTVIAGLFFIFLFTIVNLRGQESEPFYKNSFSYSYVASRKGSLAELKYERFLNEKSALHLSFGVSLWLNNTYTRIGYQRTTMLNHGFSFRWGLQYSVNSFNYTGEYKILRGFYHEINLPLEIYFKIDDRFGLLFGFAPNYDLGLLTKKSKYLNRRINTSSIINNIRLGAYHYF